MDIIEQLGATSAHLSAELFTDNRCVKISCEDKFIADVYANADINVT
jgi:hypothetical protein